MQPHQCHHSITFPITFHSCKLEACLLLLTAGLMYLCTSSTDLLDLSTPVGLWLASVWSFELACANTGPHVFITGQLKWHKRCHLAHLLFLSSTAPVSIRLR